VAKGLPSAIPGSVDIRADASGRGPSLEQQLDLSSRGATHTLAVPAAQVAKLIERINLAEGQHATLRLLRTMEATADLDGPPISAVHPLESWLTEGPRVRQAVASITSVRENVMVLVPVMIAPETALP